MSNVIEDIAGEVERFPYEKHREAVQHLVAQIGSSKITLGTLERTFSLLNAAFRDFLSETQKKAPSVRCSFCQRSQEEVRQLVAASTAAICDGCNEIVTRTIAEERRRARPHVLRRALAFLRKPGA